MKKTKVLIYIFIFLFALLLFTIFFIFRRNEENDSAKLSNVLEMKLLHVLLNSLLKKFNKLCEENGISYYAGSGTLLGAIRNQGQIKHDDDIDICMFEEDFIKLSSIIEKNDELEIRTNGVFYKILFKGTHIAWIDIFITEYYEGIYRFKSKTFRDAYPNEFHDKNDFYPIKKVLFDDTYVYVPNNSIPYLERTYGDWRKEKKNEEHEVLTW